jgi:hypothetical protein
METFDNRLQVFEGSDEKREMAVPAMSSFVYPSQKHKFLFDEFLQNRRFYGAEKTGQPTFYLSKILFHLSEIAYMSI